MHCTTLKPITRGCYNLYPNTPKKFVKNEKWQCPVWAWGNPLIHSLSHFLLCLLLFTFPFLTHFIYFLTFSIPSLSTRIGPLFFQAIVYMQFSSLCGWHFGLYQCNKEVAGRLIRTETVNMYNFLKIFMVALLRQ